jgi:CheY-like chemotaxis protein
MEWLKQQPAIQTIPVIIITGSQDPQTQKRAADAGAVACFQKPLNYELLLKAIHATLGDVPLVKNESPGAGSNPSS